MMSCDPVCDWIITFLSFFSHRASLLKSSGLSFSSLTTLKTSLSLCRCTTSPAVPSGKVGFYVLIVSRLEKLTREKFTVQLVKVVRTLLLGNSRAIGTFL